jgi:starvation-inducible outer membrane lipoprotein
MSRAILVVLTLAMLSGCIALPNDVASELEPVAHHRQDHFHKP